MRTLVGWLLGVVVWIWVRTLRVRVIDRVADADRTLDAPWILAFWHGSQVPLLAWRRRRRTAVMVSWSNDGALQSRVMHRAGMQVVRGSSSRGGARGLVAMVHAIRELALDAAFAVDGPRGPIFSVQPGAQACARHAKGRLVPIGSAAAPTKVLTRAWDRMALPWPFARAVVVVGPALPADTSASDLAAAIDDANSLAARALAERPASRVPTAIS
ncbi:MAG: DUF374 domain-containing protein [Deltaproteobacteria bacterium]|nr:DUF374 domain-containing protein [Deltaproteobacteria bacterium]